MSLFDIDWHPPDRQLKQFGVICFIALPFLTWFWGFGLAVFATMSGFGLLFLCAALVKPRLLRRPFVALTVLTTPIGFLASELAMLILFFGLFFLIGVLFKLVGRDAMHRTFDTGKESYWQSKKRPDDIVSYYRQS